MSPIAKNCHTDVRVHHQRTACGKVQTYIEAMATADKKADYVQIRFNIVTCTIFVSVYAVASGLHQHTIRWSSAFPTEPTLGDMIEAAESLARAEWFKLFPEDT